MKIAIACSALLAGAAFGHWVIPSLPVSADAPAVAPSVLPNDGLTNVAPAAALPAAATTSSPTHSDPAALAGLLREHGGSAHLRTLTDFVDNLAPGDFAAALFATRQPPRSAERDLAARLLVARWAELNPDAVLAFAAKHREFEQITGDVFQQLATNDLSGALTRAQALTDPNLRYQALRGALGIMAETDPAGALRVAATAGNPENSEPLNQAIYRQWSATDPAAAAAAAAQDPNAQGGWRSPLSEVLRNWAAQDPQGALNYALTIADPSMQTRSVGEIVRHWGQQDPTAAASSINAISAGAARDAAAAAFASSVASSDLSAAVGWAQSIGDDSARTSALQRVSRRVLWRDPTNGAVALQSAGVPAEIIQSLPPPGNR